MFPALLPTTEEKPLPWIVAPSTDIYPKGQLHPTNDPAIRNRLTWGVLLQVLGTQLAEYEREHETKEKEQWIARIRETLSRVNQLNQTSIWGLADFPACPACLAQTVGTMCWRAYMIQKLNSIFGSANPVIILKIN